MPEHIFISYASKDEKRVAQICRLLEQRGMRCWMAPRDARPGHNYGEEIIDAINRAAALLVIVSQHCNESEHVAREVERALHGNKPVVPVRIEPVEPSGQLEFFIAIKQRIDVSAPPTNEEIERLVAALRGHLEYGKPIGTPETHRQPRASLSSHRRRYTLVAASVGAAALIGMAALYLNVQRETEPRRRIAAPTAEAANTITVMEFVNQRADPVNDWYGKALQNTFNTELSKIPQLSVKAPEIIERTAKDTGVNPLLVVRQLGVTRFITGAFAVVDNTIHIDARIVQTASGVQDAAENVEGDSREFFALQKRLALATLGHFRVQLTNAQEAALQQNSRVDKYRELLRVEGVTESRAAPGATPTERQAFPDDTRTSLQPQSYHAPSGGFSLSAAAYAQAPSAEVAARQFLEEYRRFHEAGDIDHLATLYVSFPDSQRMALADYLKDVTRLRVELVNVNIETHGNNLAVSYTRRDKFVDKETGEPVTLEVRVTKFLVQDGGRWKFAEGG